MRNFDWLLLLFLAECWVVMNCIARISGHDETDWTDRLLVLVGIACVWGMIITMFYMIVAI